MATMGSLEIGCRARETRKNKKLTLESVAKSTGMSKGHLSRFERGEKSLSLASLIRLCEELNVSVGELCAAPSLKQVKDKLHVVTVAQRKFLDNDGQAPASNYCVLSKADNAHRHHSILIRLAKNQPASEPAHHGGREILFVVSGCICLTIDGAAQILEQGSYAEFDGHRPHQLESMEEQSQVLITILSTK